MTDFDIVGINTINGFVKIQCFVTDTVSDIIRKVLTDDYDWTYFGLQIEEKHRKFIHNRNFLCQKLQWRNLRMYLATADLYLNIKVFPMNIDAALSNSLPTIRYLSNQIKDQFGIIMNEVTNLELALDLTCLINCSQLKNVTSSKNSVDLKSLFPTIVNEKIKTKNLKKLIQPKLAEIEDLSEKDYLKRILVAFQKVYNFDKDEFRCFLGAGEGIPVNLLIGPRIEICLIVGQDNESRVIGFFSKIDGIHVSAGSNSADCYQIKLTMSHSSDPLVLTFEHVEDADHFVHLVDAYTGYTKMKSTCPLIMSKCPNEMFDIPEIDKSRVKRVNIIDSGQFGDVYKAILRQSDGDVDVAVKLCKAESTNEDRKLFLAEADIMRNLEHPHIVQLIGISRDDESWIVMEYCGLGQLLSYLIDNNQVIPDLTLVTFCYQIATAMAYMESKRFLHRDIAARNILVASVDCVKLSDFGKAVYLGEDSIYQGGQEKLPVKWSAIECLALRKFSFASDVWSLAVCMWEIMSRGMKPFGELNNIEVYSVLKDNKRLPRLPNCTDSFHMLLMACWASDPNKRPPFTTVKNKLNDIKIEMKKIEADIRTLSMGAGLNKKPPIKPAFASAHGIKNVDHFIVNQSMPDLLHPNTPKSPYIQARLNQNHTLAHHNRNAMDDNVSQTTLRIGRFPNNAVDDFKNKIEIFSQILLTSGTCTILQLKNFGLVIRHFLLELDKELPAHPIDHELTHEEAVIIQLFKLLIHLKVSRNVNQEEMAGQMTDVCHQMMEQADRILDKLIYYLQVGH